MCVVSTFDSDWFSSVKDPTVVFSDSNDAVETEDDKSKDGKVKKKKGTEETEESQHHPTGIPILLTFKMFHAQHHNVWCFTRIHYTAYRASSKCCMHPFLVIVRSWIKA